VVLDHGLPWGAPAATGSFVDVARCASGVDGVSTVMAVSAEGPFIAAAAEAGVVNREATATF